MNVSYNWLRSLIPGIKESAAELGERLTYTAVPVDDVVWLGEGLEDIVVGRVARVARHPNADRLVICEVDIGAGEPVQVVTGAPNVVEGAFHPFVGAGQSLPGGHQIKRTKLRGEYSEGMLCSERELGLGRDQEGIMRLHGEFTPGAALVEVLGLNDHRLVLDVTANRPDLLGHWGVAREIAAGGAKDLRLPEFPNRHAIEFGIREDTKEGRASNVAVRVEDPEGCPRYMGAVVRGVEIGPSPEWLANRLRAVGSQPINNVVDATNYVLRELNQPLHAFDLATLRGPEVVIRRARNGETLRTLDGKVRTLDADVLVIADADAPCALAGVMGGEASEVTSDTKDVFFECAYFDPKRVRYAARKLGLDTDASYRFQRGMDPVGLPVALKRVVELTLSIAGGTLEGDVVDVCPRPAETRVVRLRPRRVSHLLGVALDRDTIQSTLEPIGFRLSEGTDDELDVEVPSWRPDVTREVDLIEEVARRYGYDRFPGEIRTFRPTSIEEDDYVPVFGRLSDLLVGLGFMEAKTHPFAPAEAGIVRLINPLSEREDHLRADLLTELVHRVEYNFARGQRDVRLFELGTVFTSSGGPTPVERTRVAAAWTGRRAPDHWSGDAGQEWDAWDLKWMMSSVAELAVPGVEVRPLDAAGGSGDLGLEGPLVAVASDGQPLGWAGRVPAERVESPPWAGPVWGLEIEVVPGAHQPVAYRPLPVYPPVDRDIALIVPQNVLAAEVEAVIRESSPSYLQELSVFDVYQGDNIPEGTRSIAWRLRFRSSEGTLTDEDVDGVMRRITSALQEKLNVSIRGS